MLSEIRRLTASLPPDLADKSQRAVFADFAERLTEPLDPALAADMLSHCETLQLGYAQQSTLHIRARMLVNLLTHVTLEAELQTLLHKAQVSAQDVARIDEIAKAVEQLENDKFC